MILRACKISLSPFFLNALFLLTASVGATGLYFVSLPGSGWLSLIWVVWILINYLFLVRLKVCRHCYFYGQSCPMGWGNVVPRLTSQGCLDKFSQLTWPLIYFGSFALLPQVLMVISLIRGFSLILACLAALFGLLGLVLFLLARIFCCPTCRMKPSCFLSRLSFLINRH